MCAMPDSTAPQRTLESLTSSFHTVCMTFAHLMRCDDGRQGITFDLSSGNTSVRAASVALPHLSLLCSIPQKGGTSGEDKGREDDDQSGESTIRPDRGNMCCIG